MKSDLSGIYFNGSPIDPDCFIPRNKDTKEIMDSAMAIKKSIYRKPTKRFSCQDEKDGPLKIIHF